MVDQDMRRDFNEFKEMAMEMFDTFLPIEEAEGMATDIATEQATQVEKKLTDKYHDETKRVNSIFQSQKKELK